MYQLNLAREQVMSLEKRKRWMRWILLYLAVMIVAIAAAAYEMTVRYVHYIHQEKQLDQDERLFLRCYPGAATMNDCLRQVSGRMEGLTAKLDSVAQFQMSGQRSAPVLLGLVEPLPAGLDLAHMNFDGAGAAVSVDVFVPAAMSLDRGITVPSIISIWEKYPLLAGRVRQITSENSSRVRLEGREFVIWRFSGVLERGK